MNFGYHFARWKGSVARKRYASRLAAIARSPIEKSDARLPFEVFSYSSEAMLPEQVASIRSFLQKVGQPGRWTVVSDGTHPARSFEILRSIDAVVTVSQPNEWLPDGHPAKFLSYLREHSTGKQLALIMSLPREVPALYVDADVLFFSGFNVTTTSYLADCQLSADERLFHSEEEKAKPVNTGVLFFADKLDWSLGAARFLELKGEPNFFTNQTLTHLVMHANGVPPLDPQRFVLQLDDQFVYPDKYAGPSIALRHYVQPVRHKFWNAI